MVEPEAGLGSRQRVLWTAAALLLFGAGLASLFGPVWRLGPREVVPWPQLEAGVDTDPLERLVPLADALRDARRSVARSDQVFAVWAVADSARAWLAHPQRLFHAEPCHPASGARALGHPVLTHGLIGAPVLLATDDPVATFNFVLAASIAIGAIAMFLLVAEWTAAPAAGVVAGLLYAFGASRLGLAAYPFLFDTSWTVLALWLTRRAFASGRWRDALGAAVCCALQIALSFYAVLAAAVLAVPLLVWLVVHYGVRRLRAAPAVAAVAIVGLTSLAVFSPYLELRAAAPEAEVVKIFAPWSGLLPGRYLGWTAVALALIGLVLPRGRVLAGLGTDPRWALSIGALGIALLVTGGNVWARRMAEQAGEIPPVAWPNLYAALAVLLPGLDTVRGAATPSCGIHLVVSILAGLGAAGLIGLAPVAWRAAAGAGVVAITWLAVLHPGIVGAASPARFTALPVRPTAETLDFFETLERRGNAGPLLELPIDLRSTAYLARDSASQTLLTAYHRRRTSGCYNAKHPPELRELEAISRRVPEAGAIAELREMGFTTIVVHEPRGGAWPARLESAAAAGGALRRVHAAASMSAYEIGP